MTDTPRPRSNAISPVVTMGSGGPDTSPEEVQRFFASEFSTDMIPAPRGDYVRYEDYAALSAAMEAEKRHKRLIVGDKISAVSELLQVKAERDALKAELAEAMDFIQHVADGHPKDYSDNMDRARAFLARHQKEADT